MRTRALALLVVMTLFNGCSEDPQECGPTSSCVPAGDLEVTSVTIGPAVGTHPVTGLSVVDSLVVTYIVRNAGENTTAPALAQIFISKVSDGRPATDTIPPLERGESVTRTVRMESVRTFFPDHDTDEITARVNVFPPEASMDPRANNSRESAVHHFTLPILDVVVARLAEPRVRVNAPLRMSVTVTNKSAVAPAENIQLRHCLWDYDVACWAENWTAFGNVPLPDLAPGETRTINYTTAVPASGSEEGYLRYGLAVCVTSRADTAAYMDFERWYDTWACGGGGSLDVWPDYDACGPPVLGAQPVTLTEPNCGYYPVPADTPPSTYYERVYREKLYYVFALDAVAGKSYVVDGVPVRFVDHTGWSAPDQNPAPDRVSFPYSGRFYLIVRAWEGVKTVTAFGY